MEYVSGIHALNLPCGLDTTGDWHASGIQWEKLSYANTNNNIFGKWGINLNQKIPIPLYENKTFAIANHLRACIDLIQNEQFTIVKGMRETFIGNEKYTPLIFNKILLLQNQPNWENINKFMLNEYRLTWLKYTGQNQ